VFVLLAPVLEGGLNVLVRANSNYVLVLVDVAEADVAAADRRRGEAGELGVDAIDEGLVANVHADDEGHVAAIEGDLDFQLRWRWDAIVIWSCGRQRWGHVSIVDDGQRGRSCVC